MTTANRSMTDANRERIEEFLRKLKDALGISSERQTDDVLAEVRSNIEARLERHLAAGLSEGEAVKRAIGEMGNPFELAHHVRREVPPFAGRILTVIR